MCGAQPCVVENSFLCLRSYILNCSAKSLWTWFTQLFMIGGFCYSGIYYFLGEIFEPKSRTEFNLLIYGSAYWERLYLVLCYAVTWAQLNCRSIRISNGGKLNKYFINLCLWVFHKTIYFLTCVVSFIWPFFTSSFERTIHWFLYRALSIYIYSSSYFIIPYPKYLIISYKISYKISFL